MTVCPISWRTAAATALSTPPLMATRMVAGRSGRKFIGLVSIDRVEGGPRGRCAGGSGRERRGAGAEFRHDGRDDLERAVDFGVGGEASDAEADRRLRDQVGDAHGEEDARRMR